MPNLRPTPVPLAVCILLAAVAGSYFSLVAGLPGSFLVDDHFRIVDMQMLNLSPDMFALAITTADSGQLGRPISLASLYLTKYIHGNDPAVFKHENILLHIVTGLLLFWLTYRLLTATRNHRIDLSPESATVMAAAVAAMWILHPLHVSTVLYAVQRMTILSALFTVCALLVYVAARGQDLRRPGAIGLLFIAFPAFMLLAVFSKEDAALIPIYILLFELVLFRFSASTRKERTILWSGLSLFVLAPVMIGFAYFVTHLEPLMQDYAMRAFSLPERIASEAVIMWRYAEMVLLPRLSEMSLYHDAAPIYSLSSPRSIAALAAWIGAVIGLFLLRRRAPLIVLGVGLFVAAHLLESTIIPLELMFEHRNYFASYGLLLALGGSVYHAFVYIGTQTRVVLVFLFVLSALLGFLQHTRAGTWSDRHVLVATSLLDHPDSVRAASEMASIYVDQGRFSDAQAVLDSAVQSSGERTGLSIRIHQMNIRCFSGDRFPADLYSEVMRRMDGEPLLPYGLSGLKAITTLVIGGHCPAVSDERALALVTKATASKRTRPIILFQAHRLAAELRIHRGELREAIPHYREAIALGDAIPRPPILRALIDLADLYIELGEQALARATVDRAQTMYASGDISLRGARRLLENQEAALAENAEP